MKNYKLAFLFFLTISLNSFSADSNKKVFETYCWGCHHQTAEAFGPSFEEIASKRTEEEIKAMVIDPKSVSKLFGYSRNAMPSFKLTPDELNKITEYILSFNKHKIIKKAQ
ncbi:MAG: cytochrome c [Sulfurovum sp.]|nr:cytochrome c [Sulfurovaceae bacterium]